MNENESKKILIFGDGGLSNGFIDNFLTDPSVSEIFYTSRKQGFDENRSRVHSVYFDFDKFIENQSIDSIESILNKKPNVIIFATGILHSEEFMPEKKIDEVKLANSTSSIFFSGINFSLCKIPVAKIITFGFLFKIDSIESIL